MKYRVKEYFTDSEDGKYAYNVGASFPREGVTVTSERIKELASTKNKRGKVLIELVQSTAQEVEESVEAQEEKAGKSRREKKTSE